MARPADGRQASPVNSRQVISKSPQRRADPIQSRAQPVGGGDVDDSHLCTRISFAGTPALGPNHASRARPGLPLIRRVRLTARVTALEPQQPGYLSRSDAAATPVDRSPYGQTLIFGHCPQRLPNPAAQRPGLEHRVHRAPSPPRPLEHRAGVPGRPVLCAVRPGHLMLSGAPLASPTADSSHLPYYHRSFINPRPFNQP